MSLRKKMSKRIGIMLVFNIVLFVGYFYLNNITKNMPDIFSIVSAIGLGTFLIVNVLLFDPFLR